jgi:hypothetical protein
MERKEDEQLWDLLGQARTPEVSPFFARNVVRDIRQEPAWRVRLRRWLTPGLLIPTTSLAAAFLAALIWTHQVQPPDLAVESAPAADNDPIAKIDPQDYDVVADLDNLLASEDNNLWDDDDISSL